MEYEDITTANERIIKKMEEMFRFLSKNTDTPWEAVIVSAGVIFEICDLAEWNFEEVIDKLKEAYKQGHDMTKNGLE